MSRCSPDTLTYLLIQVCKAHRAHAGSLLGALGMHPGQEMILVALWREGELNLSELAERLGVQPPTVTRMVQRMEASGLVERCADPSDQRVSRVRASARGRAVQREVEEVWERLEQRVTRGLTLEERVLLRRLLLQVRDNLEAQSETI
jgi:MarR family transcriptional regulator, organic hydroperoxide resistance regulator